MYLREQARAAGRTYPGELEMQLTQSFPNAVFFESISRAHVDYYDRERDVPT